jgi:alkylation response protein AidB-like acyl-CoA dehydrogenase
MNFKFTDEQEALRREARRFLGRHATAAAVRRASDSERGWDSEVWQALAELGWTSLGIAPEYGGAGLGWVELTGLLEEMGAALFCAPFFSTVCLAATALTLGGSEEQKRTWLPQIAEGRLTATVALAESSWDLDATATVARRDGADWRLSGTKSYVIDGHTAQLLLVAAREQGSSGNQGLALYLLPADAAGLERRAAPTLDGTRRLAELRLDGVRVPSAARLDGGATTIARLCERAKVALAAEQVGGAARCLEASVEYAKTRVQFGRPLGSFQAIKHRCADLLVLVESARSAAYWAGWAAATDDAELPTAAALAHSYCSEAYFRCAAESIQIHGGIGFTWEHDAHLYFRRARSSALLFGDPAAERRHLALKIGL